MDVTEIIEAFNGYRDLAAALGCGRTTVFMWETKGFPPARCLELADLAKSRGLKRITLRELMHAKPRAKNPLKGRKPKDRGAAAHLNGKRP
jgi:hypothetical protein